ncbi:CBS domain-containing protein [Magnetovibrio sp. PR-2]|uniref:CBS domain-containing protein n=1 Tax=Magnetovibrio sp. PR-2 TaxID=3120356 RepID=UPI002FCDEF60
MKVSEILKQDNAPLITVNESTTVLTAAHRMRLEKIGCVVVSNDGKHAEGIVAVRDVVYHMSDHWGDDPKGDEFSYLKRKVTDIMQTPVKTCKLSDKLVDVLHMMWHFHFLHIPVADDKGDLCGIVSIDDVIKFSLSEAELESKVLREELMLTGERPLT